MSKPRITVIQESDSGRNIEFRDNNKGTKMTRSEFVTQIEKDNYKDYHIKVIKDIKTPVSNPDSKVNNNLG